MAVLNPYAETVVPRAAVSFPLRLPEPDGFDPERLETWPAVTGRLEYFDGALWFLPPCGDDQQETIADVVTQLNLWRRAHREFVVGTNEAGMKLGGEVRAADAAVWRRADVGSNTGGFRRAPPVLAVEVAGLDDTLELLKDKARWYLERGVLVVWLLVPSERRLIVVTASSEATLGIDDVVPQHSALPGLAPLVVDLFRQLEDR